MTPPPLAGLQVSRRIYGVFVFSRLDENVEKGHWIRRHPGFLKSCRRVQVRPPPLADVQVLPPQRPCFSQEVKVQSCLYGLHFEVVPNWRESSLPCTTPDWPGGAADDDVHEYDDDGGAAVCKTSP